MTVDSPAYLVIGLLLAAGVLAATWGRFALPKTTRRLLPLGATMLALAAGGIAVRWPAGNEVVVMVDLSPSTRGASFRDVEKLQARIDGLVGRNRRRIVYFPDGTAARSPAGTLADIPANRTDFRAPRADAIVLFSDGRFDPVASSTPIYPVIDPGLERPADAAVLKLATRDGQAGRIVLATVRSRGPSSLRFSGTGDRNPIAVATGRYLIESRPVADHGIAARLSSEGGSDLWPENDSLSIRDAPPAVSQKWWVGPDVPPGWKAVAPERLPIEPSDYLSAGVVALNNVPADALAEDRRGSLMKYVADFGGALIMAGGDRSFGSGGYGGTELDALSPLASAPPSPRTRWVLLVDSSGSMAAGAADGMSRWAIASKTAVGLLAKLPQADRIDVGHFASDVRWWSRGKSVAETSTLPLPPADVTPNGPTNLDAALRQLTEQTDAPVSARLPTQLLLVTDADAKLDDVQTLAARLESAGITPHLLATAPADVGNPVRQLVALRGGRIIAEPNASEWSNAGNTLLRDILPSPLRRGSGVVRFDAGLGLGYRAIDQWNRTWARESAKSLATIEAPDGPEPAAGEWAFGSGRVIAAAFATTPTEIVRLAERIAAKPRDPRMSVSWKAASSLTVSLDAVDADGYMNDLGPVLELAAEGRAEVASHPMPQAGPGHYELALPAPAGATIGTVRVGGNVVDRRAIAGRYAAEFDEIGNDRSRLGELARTTGGRLIEPGDIGPIGFPWPARYVALSSLFAGLGALAILIGAIAWKRAS